LDFIIQITPYVVVGTFFLLFVIGPLLIEPLSDACQAREKQAQREEALVSLEKECALLDTLLHEAILSTTIDVAVGQGGAQGTLDQLQSEVAKNAGRLARARSAETSQLKNDLDATLAAQARCEKVLADVAAAPEGVAA
jgi:hypothetical protein